LLQKTLEKGWKAVIETPLPERIKALDDHLWMFSEEEFLPHAVVEDADLALDTIILTTEPANPIQAHVRFCLDQAIIPEDVTAYERIILLFDGNDNEALNHARGQWKTASLQGLSITYWQQDDDGRWTKKG
jgi:DNA polymerase-3 subunit chi